MSSRNGQRWWPGIVVVGLLLSGCQDEPDIVLQVKLVGNDNSGGSHWLYACNRPCDTKACSKKADLTSQRKIAVYLDDPKVQQLSLLHVSECGATVSNAIAVDLTDQDLPITVELKLSCPNEIGYGECVPDICWDPTPCP